MLNDNSYCLLCKGTKTTDQRFDMRLTCALCEWPTYFHINIGGAPLRVPRHGRFFRIVKSMYLILCNFWNKHFLKRKIFFAKFFCVFVSMHQSIRIHMFLIDGSKTTFLSRSHPMEKAFPKVPTSTFVFPKSVRTLATSMPSNEHAQSSLESQSWRCKSSISPRRMS